MGHRLSAASHSPKEHCDGHDESNRFRRPGRIELIDKPVPTVGPNDALVRITTTTICGTDVHILKGEYRLRPV